MYCNNNSVGSAAADAVRITLTLCVLASAVSRQKASSSF
jgi:hypothetical protein